MMYISLLVLFFYLILFLTIWGFVNLEYAIGISFILLLLTIVGFEILNFITNIRERKLNKLIGKYPNAYEFFLKKMDCKDSRLLESSIISKLLANKEEVWKQKEEEINERKLSVEYNELKSKYPDGISCWEKESPYISKSVALLSRSDIVKYDKNQKKYLADKKWMHNQEEFSNLCKNNFSLMPHAGCTCYSINLPSIDYKGNKVKNSNIFWQFFFTPYCAEPDLDYTNHKQIRERFLHLKEYEEGKVKVPVYVVDEINNFIRSIECPVIILCNKDIYSNTALLTLSSQIKAQTVQIVDCTLLPEKLLSDYIIIIDGITSNTDFKQRIREIVKKYKSYYPCIVYISLMKEYSLNEMQTIIKRKQDEIEAQKKKEEEKRKAEELIKQKKIEEEKEIERRKEALKREEAIKKEKEENRRKQIQSEIQHITDDINNANIEDAIVRIANIKSLPAFESIDNELSDIIRKEEERLESEYETGIVDQYDIQRVDYNIPTVVQNIFNWNYPVVKYPKFNNVVFPYRRRRIARRGYSEANFQTYISNVFKDSKLLILGDVNILPNDNTRPYEPDIAIIAKEQPSIRIDIEIDEPYAAITKRPIHYISCGDDFRDINLNNLGWIVIRFTEYQVCTDLKGCACFIAKVLNAISPLLKLPSNLVDYPLPEPVERWSKIEAQLMASEKKRENYLNNEFGLVENEKLNTVDIKQNQREKNCASFIRPLVIQERTESPLVNYDYPSLLKNRDLDIQFFAFEHIYLYKGRFQFIPVSSVISYFFEPFDSDYWSGYKADRRHVPQGQVLEEWDCKGAKSREVGTFMHKQIENYYNDLEYELLYHFKYSGKYVKIEENVEINTEKRQFEEFVQSHPFKPFRTEWSIYDEELEIAGTIDMIHKNDNNTYDIYDWKRSHKITDAFGNPITVNTYCNHGIHGLEQIDDTNYWHYCIQQNLYKYILEKNYGIKVGKMFLVVFTDDKFDYSKLEVPYMDEAIQKVIEACQNGSVKTYLEAMGNQNDFLKK